MESTTEDKIIFIITSQKYHNLGLYKLGKCTVDSDKKLLSINNTLQPNDLFITYLSFVESDKLNNVYNYLINALKCFNISDKSNWIVFQLDYLKKILDNACRNQNISSVLKELKIVYKNDIDSIKN